MRARTGNPPSSTSWAPRSGWPGRSWGSGPPRASPPRRTRRTPDYTPKLGGKLPGWAFVLLAILVFAIATPLWGGLLGGLGLAGLICVGVGFGVVIGSFTQLTLAAGLYQAGGGLMAFAIGALLLLAVVVLVWLIVKGVRYLWNELVERGEQS